MNNLQWLKIIILTLSICMLIMHCSEEPTGPVKELPRFKSLETPIEGKLLFAAGPTLEYLDTRQNYEPHDRLYKTYDKPWDFYQLSGTQFTKLNEVPWEWDRPPSQIWNIQWSPKGNYISFYHDKGGGIWNTDDIGILDIETFSEIYLTDSLGDANTFDTALYHWADDESYIYFTALPLGQSEYDTLISPDIYRAKPDGNNLEQITNNDLYEAHAVPTHEGKKIFYGVYTNPYNAGAPFNFYLYNIENNSSELSISYDKLKQLLGNPIFRTVDTVIGLPDGIHIIYNNRLLINLDTQDLYLLAIDNIESSSSFLKYVPVHDNNFIVFEEYDEERDIYLFDNNKGSVENLTKHMTTTDGEKCFFGKPAISPSGRYLAFTAQLDTTASDNESLRNQKTDIYVMDLQTKEVRRITDGLYGWEGFLKWIE